MGRNCQNPLPLPDNTQHSQETNIHAAGGIRTQNRSKREAADQCVRPRNHWARLLHYCAVRTERHLWLYKRWKKFNNKADSRYCETMWNYNRMWERQMPCMYGERRWLTYTIKCSEKKNGDENLYVATKWVSTSMKYWTLSVNRRLNNIWIYVCKIGCKRESKCQ